MARYTYCFQPIAGRRGGARSSCCQQLDSAKPAAHHAALQCTSCVTLMAGVSHRQKLVDTLAAGTTLVVDRYAFSGAAFTAAKGVPALDLPWCKVGQISAGRMLRTACCLKLPRMIVS